MWAQATLNTVSETSSKKGKQKSNIEQIKKTYAPLESGKKSWSKKWEKTTTIPPPNKSHQKTHNLSFHENLEFLAQMSNNCCNQTSRNYSH